MLEQLDLKILKAITTDKISALSFSHKYDSEVFDEDSRRFAKLTLDYIKHFHSPPTRRTLLDRHRNSTTLANVINEAWDELDATTYDVKEFSYDVNEVKSRFKEKCVENLRNIAASDDPDNPTNPEEYFNNISMALAKINSFESGRTHIQKPIGDFVDEFQESYEARLLNPEVTIEVPTGYSFIDTISPFCPGELIIVGGESGKGKSILLNGLGKQIWLQGNTIDTDPYCFTAGKNVLFFSLEMSYDMCFNRFLASLANIPQTELRKAKLDPEQTYRKDKALEFIKKYQEAGHYFDIVDVPRNVTIEEVELRYQEAILRYEPDVVIIDYLTLMGSDALSKEADWLKVGGIAASLHEFARSNRCVVVTAAQLTDIKRNAQSGSSDENKTIGMHRFGRSSLIIHNVDSAIQIETRNNENKLPDMKIHYVKNRKGPLGQGNLVKNFANASLIDVPYDQSDLPGDISANIPDLIKSIQDAKNKKDG
jgi:replicative DNA helicase